MTHFVSFGRQIEFSLLFSWCNNRNLLDHREIESRKRIDLLWIIRQQPNRGEPQIFQDLQADTVVTRIRFETEFVVRLDRIISLILELIGLEFGE